MYESRDVENYHLKTNLQEKNILWEIVIVGTSL